MQKVKPAGKRLSFKPLTNIGFVPRFIFNTNLGELFCATFKFSSDKGNHFDSIFFVKILRKVREFFFLYKDLTGVS